MMFSGTFKAFNWNKMYVITSTFSTHPGISRTPYQSHIGTTNTGIKCQLCTHYITVLVLTDFMWKWQTSGVVYLPRISSFPSYIYPTYYQPSNWSQSSSNIRKIWTTTLYWSNMANSDLESQGKQREMISNP